MADDTIIDYDENKPFNIISALDYINRNSSMAREFMQEKIRHKDWKFIVHYYIQESPTFFANLLKINYEENVEQRLLDVLELVLRPGNLTYIIGAKGSGKTATAFWIAELALEAGIPVWWYGYNPAITKAYPEIEQTFSLKDLKGKKGKGLLLYDEALVTFGGKEWYTERSKDKARLLPLLRHRDLSLVMMAQHMGANVDIMRTADIFWYKPYAAIDIDRDVFKKTFVNLLKFLMPSYSNENTILHYHTMRPYLIENPLPKAWNNELSKGFSLLTAPEAKKVYIKLAQAIRSGDMDEKEMIITLKVRGWLKDDIEKKYPEVLEE